MATEGGSDMRVVERHSSVAGAYCGRLLGMLGADVVKLEPPGGDAMRAAQPLVASQGGARVSALFEYLNCFKRGVELDPGEAVETGDAILASADIVVDYVDGDPDRALDDYRRLSAANGGLIYVAISGFGLTGPYRGYKSNDFIDFASGGYTYITGEPHREPVQGGGPWAGYLVGTTAAAVALAALRNRRRTGQGQLVDVGAMEAIASCHQWTLVLYTHQGVVKRRAGNMHAESFNPLGLVPCRDGWACIGVASAPQWESFCLAIDQPELLIDDRFQSGGDRFDHAEELKEIIEPIFMSMSAEELVKRCHDYHCPAGPVLGVLDVLDEPQLASRDYWASSEKVGGGAKMPERPFHLPGADAPFREAPRLGQHTAEVVAELGDQEGRP
jgi:crotonobetainyl-CoA:carnitine CoA-transferase CaiB-like acyl-CoA transferase